MSKEFEKRKGFYEMMSNVKKQQDSQSGRKKEVPPKSQISASGSVLTDVDLTDGRFLDVRPIRVCFPSGLKARSRIPVLDVFFDSQQVADKSQRPRKGRADVQSSSSPKALSKKCSQRSTGTLDAFAFSTLLGRSLSVQKVVKKRRSVKPTSVKTDPQPKTTSNPS